MKLPNFFSKLKGQTTVKTVTGQNRLGWLPGVIIFAVVITGVYLATKDKEEAPEVTKSRKAAEERKNLVITPGDPVNAAMQSRKIEKAARESTKLEKAEAMSAPKVTDPNAGEKKASTVNADSVLRALEGKQEEPDIDSSKASPSLDEQNSDMKSVVTGLLTPPKSSEKLQRKFRPAATQGTAGSGSSSGNVKAQSLTIFRAKPLKAPEAAAPLSGYDQNRFLPLGATIQVVFFQQVESSSASDLIEVVVTENVFFNHKLQLPFGTHVFVNGGAKVVRDRMMFTAGTILYPTGEEGTLSGVLMGDDDAVGVRGYWKSFLTPKVFPYVNQIIAGTVAAAQSQSSNVSAIGGALSVQSSLKDGVLQAASRAITDSGNTLEKTIQDRYQDYLIIPKGTAATIRLTSSVDLTHKAKGASGPKANSKPSAVTALDPLATVPTSQPETKS